MPGESLGNCCACGREDGVRNIHMLPRLAPIPGRGWGCVVCGLPLDGAIAVVCDPCHEERRPLLFACFGYPAANDRVPIEDLAGKHEHRMELHLELEGAIRRRRG